MYSKQQAMDDVRSSKTVGLVSFACQSNTLLLLLHKQWQWLNLKVTPTVFRIVIHFAHVSDVRRRVTTTVQKASATAAENAVSGQLLVCILRVVESYMRISPPRHI